MSDETPIPWAENDRARLVYARLREGPRTTVELQKAPIIHVARQIWELRHWYGYRISTGRRGSVALYTLLPEVPVGVAIPPAAPSRAPVFGDPTWIRQARG